jgi:hypothetical protein
MMTQDPTPQAVIADSTLFAEWWESRSLPDDRAIVAAATSAGLVTRTENRLLWLTDAGRRLRGNRPGRLSRMEKRDN